MIMVRSAVSCWVLAMACALLAGCSMKADVGSIVLKAGRPHITVDLLVGVTPCTGAVQGGTISASCTLTDAGIPASRTSSIALTGLSSGDTLQLIPLVVLEVPSDAANFAGTYNNQRGTSGALRFNTGLTSVAVDANTTLTAESGMQLVIMELPPGISPDTYFIVAAYDASSLSVKALAAVRAVVSGLSFILPIDPCTTSFASVPAVSIPNTPIETHIDVSAAQPAYVACTNKTFTYAGMSVPATISLIEYYNRQLDHYFMTALAAEIAALDAGTTIRGWQRTGVTIKAYATAAAALSAVCRYYIPPLFGDSHFFGRGTQECTQTGTRFPAFILEDAANFYVILPTNGTCPAGAQPIYRVFSNRLDANHRYMIDSAIRAAMVAAGWLAEGDGPNLVVMCGPM